MVGMTAAVPRERVARLISSAKFASDIPSKLNLLRQLSDVIHHADSALLSEFLSSLLDLLSDPFGPVRKFMAEVIGSIGLRHMEFLPEIIPGLIALLKDDVPAVARQAITCGIDIFRCTLAKVALQGLHSSELGESLQSSWTCVLKFKDEIYSMAFQSESDGRTLLALKFVESAVLLYTPDPTISSEPPSFQDYAGMVKEFNISWLRGGHPILDIGNLSVEASQSLGVLLDQLRFPIVKSVGNLVIVVLIYSLSAIARKRPAYYGRILPVLLGLDPSSSASKRVQFSRVHHALKNVFRSCLNCTHPGAVPWRNRLAGALKEMEGGGLANQELHQLSQSNGTSGWKDDSPISKDEKLSVKPLDVVHENSGRKRLGGQGITEVADDEKSVKRVKSEVVLEQLAPDLNLEQGRHPSNEAASEEEIDNGPVEQLVAMFASLVSQGETAVGYLEILISSISPDMLAEVVMTNMRNLPQSRSSAEEQPLLPMGSYAGKFGSDKHLKNLSSLLTDALSRSGALSDIDTGSGALSVSNEPEQRKGGEDHLENLADSDAPLAMDHASDQTQVLSVPILPSHDFHPETGNSGSVIPEVANVGYVESEIPGLDSVSGHDGSSDRVIASSFVSTVMELAPQEQFTNLVRSPLEVLPSVSTDRSEELSPKIAVTDVTSINSSANSLGSSTQFVLPKMLAPVVDLADEQKDNLQKLAFARVIDAYKQIAISGGSQVRFSILAYLGVEFPLDLDPWKLLQAHILSDYANLEGHELTLRVLYRLFGEAEEEQDFLSSTTATSVYETFLLTVAETLRDSFPASDKSLSRLLGEVPHLPKSIFNLLEGLCCPGSNKDEKELHGGDRVTQGLSSVWSLILLRPTIRDACLKIALQSAVHHLEDVRMKAIRLVANKLYPLSSISQQIEDFAKEMLLSVANADNVTDPNNNGCTADSQKDYDLEKSSNEPSSEDAATKDVASDVHLSSTPETTPSASITVVQRCMSLYFALCTKKHSLLQQIFIIYQNTSNPVKQAIHRQIPMLVRTIGSSPDLLEIISDPPLGCESLLKQVLLTLTDGTIPSPELIATIRRLYERKVNDVQILLPILPFLPKEEVLLIFPKLLDAPLDYFQAALSHVLQGTSLSGPVLSPTEALIAIHGIDPDRDGIPLKKVTDACNACFEQRQIFTQQVLAKVLNQLVEQIPLPLLFMRTVLQAIGAFPSLVEFIMEILSRLVSKQIWKNPKLWVGFVKCAQLTKPQSFGVLLQLPPAQLENALNRVPGLRAPLVAHANQPHIKSSLPRSVLGVLGVVSEPQSSNQTQAQAGDTGISDKQAVAEKSKESSAAN